MEPKTLVRNANTVHAIIQETDKGALVVGKECKILIPTRFAERKLAVISNEIRIVSVFVMVVDDKYYSVSKEPAMMQITPTSTNVVSVMGDEYYEFVFAKGSQITPNINLVKDDSLVYHVYDEIVAKGHVPWFFSYEDLGKLFVNADYHGGLSLGPNNVVMEMICASIARNIKDRTQYYRHLINSMSEQHSNPPAFIALRNIIFGATNTTARLTGSYFDDGLASALVNPSEKTETVEDLLRR